MHRLWQKANMDHGLQALLKSHVLLGLGCLRNMLLHRRPSPVPEHWSNSSLLSIRHRDGQSGSYCTNPVKLQLLDLADV